MEENFEPMDLHQRDNLFRPGRVPVKVLSSPNKIQDPVENELKSILEEIKIITNKIRDEVILKTLPFVIFNIECFLKKLELSLKHKIIKFKCEFESESEKGFKKRPF